LGRLLGVLSPTELARGKIIAPELFNGLNYDLLLLHYATARVFEVGFDRANSEGTLGLMERVYLGMPGRPRLNKIAFSSLAPVVGKWSVWWIDDEIETKLRQLGQLENAKNLLATTSRISGDPNN
jgi:hypothetical protein